MFFGSVQIISPLDSQSKFQMFALLSGCHIGGLGSIILHGTFWWISQLWDNAHTLNLENCLLYLLSIISQFLDFNQWMVFDFIFYWVTMHTLYCALVFAYSKEWWKGLFFDHSIQNRHGLVWDDFLIDGKTLYLEQKNMTMLKRSKW